LRKVPNIWCVCVQFGESFGTKLWVSSNVVGLVNVTVIVTFPSPTADGPEYCHTLGPTREKVYGAGSWFFQPSVSPWGVICTRPYDGVNEFEQSPVAMSSPGVGMSQIDTRDGVKSLDVGIGLAGGATVAAVVAVGGTAVWVAVGGTDVSVGGTFVAEGVGVALGRAVAVAGTAVRVGGVVGEGGRGEAVAVGKSIEVAVAS
jgi:hypothetical protein